MLAGEANTAMPDWVVGKVMDSLNDRGKALKGARVLVLGIAYKKNDMRESPSVELMEKLQNKGAIVAYSDPYVPIFPKMREHYFDLKSAAITPETLRGGYDCVLVGTHHDTFDYEMIRENSVMIIDTRGVYRSDAINLVKA